MSETPYIPFYTSDFLGGTSGMTAASKGVYITLLCLMYEMERPLAQDWSTLARRCGCTLPAFKKSVDSLQDDGKIEVTDEGIWSTKCEKHITQRCERRNSAKAAAEKRWEKTKESQGKSDAAAMRTQCQSESEPESYKKNNVHRFDEFWGVWPHKKSKADAQKAWAKLTPEEREAVISKTQAWCRQWRNEYPNASHILPASFLRGRRWEDEASETTRARSAGEVNTRERLGI